MNECRRRYGPNYVTFDSNEYIILQLIQNKVNDSTSSCRKK